jgi:hypothetical protein
LLRVLGRLPLMDGATGSGGRRPRTLNRRRHSSPAKGQPRPRYYRPRAQYICISAELHVNAFAKHDQNQHRAALALCVVDPMPVRSSFTSDERLPLCRFDIRCRSKVLPLPLSLCPKRHVPSHDRGSRHALYREPLIPLSTACPFVRSGHACSSHPPLRYEPRGAVGREARARS